MCCGELDSLVCQAELGHVAGCEADVWRFGLERIRFEVPSKASYNHGGICLDSCIDCQAVLLCIYYKFPGC